MVCAIDSTCSSKGAKWGFGFVGLNQNIFIDPQKLSSKEASLQLRHIECTISSKSQNQGGPRNGSGIVVRATQREKQGRTNTGRFPTATMNSDRRREGRTANKCQKHA
jgi:hypothetical protein